MEITKAHIFNAIRACIKKAVDRPDNRQNFGASRCVLTLKTDGHICLSKRIVESHRSTDEKFGFSYDCLHEARSPEDKNTDLEFYSCAGWAVKEGFDDDYHIDIQVGIFNHTCCDFWGLLWQEITDMGHVPTWIKENFWSD